MSKKNTTLIKDRGELANLITKLEGGKSQAKIGDIRQAFKKIIELEAYLINKRYKSAVLLLRKEAKKRATVVRQQRAKLKKAKKK